MYIQNASVYMKDRLHEEAPQRICQYFTGVSRMRAGEDIAAVFGSINNAKGPDNCAVLLNDRIVYMEFRHMLPRDKTVPLEMIDQIYLIPEEGYSYIAIVDKGKDAVKLKIKATDSEESAFYNLIRERMQQLAQHRAVKPGALPAAAKCPNCGASCKGYKGEGVECEYCNTMVIL